MRNLTFTIQVIYSNVFSLVTFIQRDTGFTGQMSQCKTTI